MLKKIMKMVVFNICVILLEIAIASNRFLGLNALKFDQSPVRYGLSWAILVFVVGIFGYENYKMFSAMSKHLRHAEKLVVKDVVLTDVEDALQKLTIAKKENSLLASKIGMIYTLVNAFQSKLDILNQLLANHGKKLSEQKWMIDFNNESQEEILANVREVIDTSIIFDDANATTNNVDSATMKIEQSANRIEEILQKYDEFLSVVQKVLERNLRSHGTVVTDSLDATIQSVKQVYGISEEVGKTMSI